MNYCGIDLSKKSSHFCIMNEQREVLSEGKVANRISALREVFAKTARMRVVVEACGNAFWFADVLSGMGHDVVVVDPGRTKAIGSGMIKHDKLDARILATLCQANLMAEVHRPTQPERIARMPIAVRDALVRTRTLLINQVRSLLHSEGIEMKSSATNAFSAAVREAYERIPDAIVAATAPLLESIDHMNEQVDACDKALAEAVQDDPVIKRLRTLPGIGPITAAQFAYAILDPARFASSRQVSAYLGLVPSLYSSGQTHRLGRITKRGSRRTRWLLTMAANALLRSSKDSRLARWGKRKVHELGRKKAVVALARKMAGILWAMWRHQRDFEPRLAPAN